MAPRNPFGSGDLDELFAQDDGGKSVTIHEPKYKIDINFSWLIWLALFFMIILFRGDPDLHDATIDYVMHKNHKDWIECYREYDHRGHKWNPMEEVEDDKVNDEPYWEIDGDF